MCPRESPLDFAVLTNDRSRGTSSRIKVSYQSTPLYLLLLYTLGAPPSCDMPPLGTLYSLSAHTVTTPVRSLRLPPRTADTIDNKRRSLFGSLWYDDRWLGWKMNNLIGRDLIQHGHIPTHTHLLPVSLREKEDDAGNSPFKDVITTSTLSIEDWKRTGKWRRAYQKVFP